MTAAMTSIATAQTIAAAAALDRRCARNRTTRANTAATTTATAMDAVTVHSTSAARHEDEPAIASTRQLSAARLDSHSGTTTGCAASMALTAARQRRCATVVGRRVGHPVIVLSSRGGRTTACVRIVERLSVPGRRDPGTGPAWRGRSMACAGCAQRDQGAPDGTKPRHPVFSLGAPQRSDHVPRRRAGLHLLVRPAVALAATAVLVAGCAAISSQATLTPMMVAAVTMPPFGDRDTAYEQLSPPRPSGSRTRTASRSTWKPARRPGLRVLRVHALSRRLPDDPRDLQPGSGRQASRPRSCS